MMSHYLEVAGSDGRPVRGDWHVASTERATLEGPAAQGLPDTALPPPHAVDAHAPWVIVCHGFKGFRNWGFFPWICEALSRAGFHAVRFDFSHNGVEEVDFDRLDLFAIDTPTRHQEDLRAVLDEIERMCGSRTRPSIALVGHSRGGADALLCAASDARVQAIATLAGTADLSRGFDASEEILRRVGYLVVPNARTGQSMPVTRSTVDDSRRHDVLAAARECSDRPLFLAHGTEDEAVPPEDAQRLASAHGHADLFLSEHARHTFGAVHPFTGPTEHLEQVCARLVAFLRRSLHSR